MIEVAPGVHRLGTDVVNWYVVEEGGRLTIVDAGAPRHWLQLLGLLERTDLLLDDVDAVVLTHAHADHLGIAERARTEASAPVHVHHADRAMAIGEGDDRETEAGMARYFFRPAALKTMTDLLLGGLWRPPTVTEAAGFGDGEVLDVPGRLRVVHTPGHSPGNCALVSETRQVTFCGDTLATWNPLTGRRGPQIMPSAFNTSSEQALASLDALRGAPGPLLPGHGDPWTGPVEEAVEAAHRAGRS